MGYLMRHQLRSAGEHAVPPRIITQLVKVSVTDTSNKTTVICYIYSGSSYFSGNLIFWYTLVLSVLLSKCFFFIVNHIYSAFIVYQHNKVVRTREFMLSGFLIKLRASLFKIEKREAGNGMTITITK